MNSVLATELRILTFRASREELQKLGSRHLLFGLLCTWLVGMGRAWDDTNAGLAMSLGVGSLLYVAALSLFLWLVFLPLRPEKLGYGRILTYVSLTAPPAALYSIPVEWWLAPGTAAVVNVWFLGIVAAWRVALLAFFLRRGGHLGAISTAAGVLFPLTLIVTVLGYLSLLSRTADSMSGVREQAPPDAFATLLMHLGTVSAWCLLPVCCLYAGQCWVAWFETPPRPD